MATCPNCGEIVMEGDPYCSNCGATLDGILMMRKNLLMKRVEEIAGSL